MTPTTETLSAATIMSIFVAWNTGLRWRLFTAACIATCERYLANGGLEARDEVWS